MVDPLPHSLKPSESVIFAADIPPMLRERVRLVLFELDRLHRIPKQMRVTVGATAIRREQGSYDPRHIHYMNISRYAVDPEGTFLHEFGHFLDNRILHPIPLEYASRYDADYDELKGICLESSSIRSISSLLRLRRSLSRSDVLFLRYAIEPHEIFARAYAQWVCTRSDNPLLKTSLERRLSEGFFIAGRFCKFQWDVAGFVDIIPELERVFRKKGLL